MPGKSDPSYSADEDDLVDKAYTYVTEVRYPEGCLPNQKRTIRKKAAKFVVGNGELMYRKYKRKTKGGPKVNGKE